MSDDKSLARRNALAAALSATDPELQEYLSKVSDEKIQRISRSVTRLSHGLHASAPLTCYGPSKCPFIDHCPIPSREQKLNKQYGDSSDYPLARACILEESYQKMQILSYIRHLDVDPANPIEMALVNELAILDLHKNRALMIMSEGDKDGEGRDFLRQDESYQEAADEAKLVKATSLHPAFDVIDRLERRRERLLDRLLETRKAKAEMDLKRGVATEDSNVLKELQAVRKYLEGASKQTEHDPDIIDLPD